MIELRWLKKIGHHPGYKDEDLVSVDYELQYRQQAKVYEQAKVYDMLSDTYHTEWSDWQDVPTVEDESKG